MPSAAGEEAAQEFTALTRRANAMAERGGGKIAAEDRAEYVATDKRRSTLIERLYREAIVQPVAAEEPAPYDADTPQPGQLSMLGEGGENKTDFRAGEFDYQLNPAAKPGPRMVFRGPEQKERGQLWFIADPVHTTRLLRDEGEVLTAYLTMRNPLITEHAGSTEKDNKVIAEAREQGHDGVIFTDNYGEYWSFVVFDEAQVQHDRTMPKSELSGYLNQVREEKTAAATPEELKAAIVGEELKWWRREGDDWRKRWGHVAELVPVQVLKRYVEYNWTRGHARNSPEIWDALKEDIKQHGIRLPLLLEYNPETRQAIIGEGNHRLAIADELGIESVPVMVERTRSTRAGGRSEKPMPTILGGKDPWIEKEIPGIGKRRTLVAPTLKPSHIFPEGVVLKE